MAWTVQGLELVLLHGEGVGGASLYQGQYMVDLSGGYLCTRVLGLANDGAVQDKCS